MNKPGAIRPRLFYLKKGFDGERSLVFSGHVGSGNRESSGIIRPVLAPCEKVMAAHLENRDVQCGIEMAWHGETLVVPAVTKELAFPYEIERCPLFVESRGEFIPLEGWNYFRCSDDGLPAGKPVADTYVAVTNSRFWEIVHNSVGGGGFTIESAGTIFDRARRFITVKLGTDADSFTVGNRVFKNRFTILDSIDGSTNLYGINTSVCVVCANTFRMAMNDKKGEFRFKIKHTKNLVPSLEGMEKAVENFIGVSAQFEAAMREASSIAVKPETAREAFAGFLGNEGGEALSTRSLNTVRRLVSLYRGGAGNNGETLLDAFSAVTDFYSHESSGGESKPGFRAKQALSSEYGAGMRAKVDFFGEIFTTDKDGNHSFNRSGFDSMVACGRSVLARTELVSAN